MLKKMIGNKPTFNTPQNKIASSTIPRLFFLKNTVNQHLIQALPQLSQPYKTTPWLHNRHLQIAYYIARQQLKTNLNIHQIETCPMPDGATTELVWLNQHVSPTTPTIVVLHTITASIRSMSELLQDLSHLTGWRIVLCCRRGHSSQPQPFSSVNIMGSVPDFKVQLAQVQQQYPDSPLFALGSSAGSATLARYLGEVGQHSPLQAAFLYCPGYDLTTAFNRVYPFYDYYLAHAVKKKFIHPYQNNLKDYPSYTKIMRIKKLSHLQNELFEFAGFATQQDYLKTCNPADVIQNIHTPTMILNADDDPICHIDNATPFLGSIQRNPYTILVTTQHGSHCGYYTGWKPKSWANQLMASYFKYMYQYNDFSSSLAIYKDIH